MNDVTPSSPMPAGEFLLYTAPDGAVKVEVFCRDETVWLTQKALAALFGVQVPAIAKHLKNIYSSADAQKLCMGLTTWKHAPHGKILKSDVTVAKNYLNQAHVRELNRIVSAYLDLAENRAECGILMEMADWIQFLNSFLELSDYPVLEDKCNRRMTHVLRYLHRD